MATRNKRAKGGRPVQSVVTRHDGLVKDADALAELERATFSCLLWERQYYESGASIAGRLYALGLLVEPEELADVAIRARHDYKLRHAPLWLLLPLLASKRGMRNDLAAETIAAVVQRPDEMTELLSLWLAHNAGEVKPHKRQGASLYVKDKEGQIVGSVGNRETARVHGLDIAHDVPPGYQPKTIPHALRRGLTAALQRFDEYQLAKYDRSEEVKLRDVLRLIRPKPSTDAQSKLWQRVAMRKLRTPDTWEVALSAGEDKRATWERLLETGTLGYDALLKNLRNMQQAGVDAALVRAAIVARRGAHKVLPFRFVAAARACPAFEPALDEALVGAIAELPALDGETVIMVDVSDSMSAKLSEKSDLTRMDAAATLAAMIPGQVRVFTFSDHIVEVPPRCGMAGVDAIVKSQPHRSTRLNAAIRHVNALARKDRLIVLTDEETTDGAPPPPEARHAYLINVASYEYVLQTHGRWQRLAGFSEHVLSYIRALETRRPRAGSLDR